MAGDRDSDENTAIEAAYPVTEETAAFADAIDAKKIDPWVELTDGGADEEDPDVVDALDWALEPEPPPPPDGPVPVALDSPPPPPPAPAPKPRARLASDLAAPPRARSNLFASELVAPEPAIDYAQQHREMLNQPVVVARRTQKKPKKRKRSRVATPAAPERRYPKMRALLLENAPALESDAPHEAAPPVPGTFFPAPRAPIARPAPVDLDEMLAAMAEGLLIGETPEGGTEVRVTLKDEFFAGTELRIRVGQGTISAELVPPDRDIYWQLNGNLEELHERLVGRGLSVEHLVVVEP